MCFLLFASVLSSTVTAQDSVENDYVVYKNVADRDPDTLRKATRAGLVKVLKRVAPGDITEAGKVQAALRSASALLQEYAYVSKSEQGLGLRLTYNARRITKLVRSVGSTSLLPDRKDLLIWLQQVDDDETVSLRSAPALASRMWREARSLGVPIVFPVHRLAEKGLAEEKDIVGEPLAQRVKDSAAQYGANGVLIGRATVSESGYTIAWSLRIPQQGNRDFETTAVSLEDAAAQGIGRVSQLLAGTAFINQGQRDNQSFLRISGIDSAQEYGRVEAYLGDLLQVRAAHLLEVSQDNILFDLLLDKSEAELIMQLDKDNELGSVDRKLIPNLGSQYGQLLLYYLR